MASTDCGVTNANEPHSVAAFDSIPGIRGNLLTDEAARRGVARDAGGLVSLLPVAVLQPACIDDVVRAVRVCGARGVKVVARGRAHTTFGQSQVEAGLVVDMSSLATIHEVAYDSVRLDAGATWRQLLVRTCAIGRTPPVLTGFQGLSVGGTLSVGGISGVSYRRGAQIDHVLSLEVVTGDGRLMTCSAEENADLFRAVLGGGGRVGLIVRATIPLVAAEARVRHTVLSFSSLSPFLRSLRELSRRSRLDGLSGTICLAAEGNRFDLNAVSFYTPPNAPDTRELLRDISGETTRSTEEFEYLDYCLQVDRLIDGLHASGGWDDKLHPWFDVFLPDADIEQFLSEVLGTLDPDRDVGGAELGALGQLHLFPLLTEHLQRPWLRVPRGRLVFLFDILSSSRGSDALFVVQMLERNRRLFERARWFSGVPYAIAAIPLSPAERIEQLGSAFSEFALPKRRYDPSGLMRDLGQ